MPLLCPYIETSGGVSTIVGQALNDDFMFTCVLISWLGLNIQVNYYLSSVQQTNRFSGFSVGSCINEEEGYLLPT